jgi:hypothetical protein
MLEELVAHGEAGTAPPVAAVQQVPKVTVALEGKLLVARPTVAVAEEVLAAVEAALLEALVWLLVRETMGAMGEIMPQAQEQWAPVALAAQPGAREL